MTSNVVNWLNVEEAARANKAREVETARHNQMVESETRRSNVAKELHNWSVLQESRRHSQATEAEATRSNRASESIKREQNVLQSRSNAINLYKAIAESADRRYATTTQRRSAQEQIAATRWKNRADIELGYTTLSRNLGMQQQKLDQERFLTLQSIEQRREAAYQQYSLGQDKLSQERWFKAVDVGVGLLKTGNIGSLAKNLYNRFQLLGY